MISKTVLPILLFCIAAAVPAQSPTTIELDSGEVVIGRLLEVTDDNVRVEVDYPDPDERRIDRDEIRARSMFALLAARVDPSSAEQLRELAKDAADLGLPGHAIASLRAASRADESGRTENDLQVRRIRNAIAEDIVEQARAALEIGNEAAAQLDATFVTESLADTRWKDDADEILSTVRRRLSGAQKLEPIDAEETRDVLEEVEERLRNAEKDDLLSYPKSASIDAEHRERVERAIRVLERLWQPLSRRVPAETVEAQLSQHYDDVRARVRSELVDQYLALGQIRVQLGALPDASDINEKACALDPDSPGCGRLRRLIVQARIQAGRLN